VASVSNNAPKVVTLNGQTHTHTKKVNLKDKLTNQQSIQTRDLNIAYSK
jgi:hypothetical protein